MTTTRHYRRASYVRGPENPSPGSATESGGTPRHQAIGASQDSVTMAAFAAIGPMRIECPVCGRVVSGRVPKGGTGDAEFPRPHLDPGTKDRCEGRFWLVDIDRSAEDYFRYPEDD